MAKYSYEFKKEIIDTYLNKNVYYRACLGKVTVLIILLWKTFWAAKTRNIPW